ncbi:hypothetical protein JJ685_24290 [Ramlibacter monticola]|uniref:Uncharacterized protein n=1 Tax=Ramlibacter monticola TaxID=1926872 RepID=A0A936Z550_9BURK|nr:hypothetical protein [Ramlibacter monticola]MBL0394281.1 hypothetical protein [Ramlibacter monticola]
MHGVDGVDLKRAISAPRSVPRFLELQLLSVTHVVVNRQRQQHLLAFNQLSPTCLRSRLGQRTEVLKAAALQLGAQDRQQFGFGQIDQGPACALRSHAQAGECACREICRDLGRHQFMMPNCPATTSGSRRVAEEAWPTT